MKYLDMLEKLQKENEGYIILMKNGIFFVAVGKDAIELNKSVGLKLTCMREKLCKVGFQVKSVEKYIEKIKQTGKSFAIYVYDKNTEKEEQIFKFTGEPVTETKTCADCSCCNRKSESTEDIIERVKKLGAK